MRRVEQRQLHAAPVHDVVGAVDLQPVRKPLGLEADLVVDQRIGVIADGLQELIAVLYGRRVGSHALLRDHAAVDIRLSAVEATRTETLRVSVISHRIGRDVPGEVAAIDVAAFALLQVDAEAIAYQD